MEQSFLDREPTGRLFLGEWFEEDSKGIDLPLVDRMLLEDLPQIDLNAISPDMFNKEEKSRQSFPNKTALFYLFYFHKLANGILKDEPNRGFIYADRGDGVAMYRGFEAEDARIMETAIALVFFYTADRPWNVYKGDPRLLKLIEAAYRYIRRRQRSDGALTRLSFQFWAVLTACGFGGGKLGCVLYMLEHSNYPVPKRLIRLVRDILRRVLIYTLTSETEYMYGAWETNKYIALLSGAAIYAYMHPEDDQIKDLLFKRMEDFSKYQQSPAGYFYEITGPEYAYFNSTAFGYYCVLFHYLKLLGREDLLRDTYILWNEWLSYNLLPEPGSNMFRVNNSISTRTDTPTLQNIGFSITEFFPESWAFAQSIESYNEALSQNESDFDNNWPEIDDLLSYWPSQFEFRGNLTEYGLKKWCPTASQIESRRRLLPCFSSSSFIHQRKDFLSNPYHPSPRLQEFTYVKSPTYYCAFNVGNRVSTSISGSGQRMGMGLLWNSQMGTIIQGARGNSGIPNGSWGVVRGGVMREGEATFSVNYFFGETLYTPVEGNSTFPIEDLLKISYSVDDGKKDIIFNENDIEVVIQRDGDFYDQIPLLISSINSVVIVDNVLEITKNSHKFYITHTGATNVEYIATGGIVRLRIHGNGSLSYKMNF